MVYRVAMEEMAAMSLLNREPIVQHRPARRARKKPWFWIVLSALLLTAVAQYVIHQ